MGCRQMSAGADFELSQTQEKDSTLLRPKEFTAVVTNAFAKGAESPAQSESWKRVHSVPGVVKKTLPNVRSDENWGRFEHPSVLVSAWKQPRVVLEKHKLIRSTSEVHRKDATVGRPRVLSSTVPEVSSTKGGRKGLPTQPRSGERMHSRPGADTEAVTKLSLNNGRSTHPAESEAAAWKQLPSAKQKVTRPSSRGKMLVVGFAVANAARMSVTNVVVKDIEARIEVRK
ncbi:hypothetical protein B0H14DRAFT_2881026 [Mycena olivaceomarginata]|nr:hypothetical protein B0H14DRAFT_2881026 [Mycena olivaceomarginata]